MRMADDEPVALCVACIVSWVTEFGSQETPQGLLSWHMKALTDGLVLVGGSWAKIVAHVQVSTCKSHETRGAESAGHETGA